MKILYSPEYSGAFYLKSPVGEVMMDTIVVNTLGLLALIEFRLGLKYSEVAAHERMASYYGAMRRYMRAKPDNVFAKSFDLSGPGTAKTVLTWRDELAMAGWDFQGAELSERLAAMIGIEEYFAKENPADVAARISAATKALERRPALCADWCIVTPMVHTLYRPIEVRLVDAVKSAGAAIEVMPVPAARGANLAKVRDVLEGKVAAPCKLDPEDDSFQIWKFYDEHSACQYLAAKGDGLADVRVNTDNKELDNWLALLGKPVSGSSMGNCSPQITQLFILGLSLFGNPLNINSLVEWLNLPTHPLDSYFRGCLARAVAEEGGFRNQRCRRMVLDYIEGAFVYLSETERAMPEDWQNNLRKEDRRERRKKAALYLPSFTPEEATIKVSRICRFVVALASWCRQKINSFYLPANRQTTEQLAKVAEMCDTLRLLLDINRTDTIELSLLDSWVSTIYRGQTFTHAVAEAGANMVVDSAAKILSETAATVWLGLDAAEEHQPDCAFLFPTEREGLTAGEHLRPWDSATEQDYRMANLLTPVRMTTGRLILVVCEHRCGEPTEKHPLLIRLGQAVENLESVTIQPGFEPEDLEEISKVNKQVATAELHFGYADKLAWPGHLSPTSIGTLVEHPFDYLMERLLNICNDERAQIADVRRIAGNVAHGVIERLFAPDGSSCDGSWPAIKNHIEADYERVFDEVVEAKGAVFHLSENRLEAKYLRKTLRKNLDALCEILRDNDLRVTGCERLVEHTLGLGLPEERDNEGNIKDRDMLGFIDMTLEDQAGRPVVIDFKWTSSKSYYSNLILSNRSIQLELYRHLLGVVGGRKVGRVAYFLMPRGRLYSKDGFYGRHCETITPEKDDDIVEQLRNAALYRKSQLDNGIVETGRNSVELHYCADTDQLNLYPLDLDKNGMKNANRFSKYSLFATTQSE